MSDLLDGIARKVMDDRSASPLAALAAWRHLYLADSADLLDLLRPAIEREAAVIVERARSRR